MSQNQMTRPMSFYSLFSNPLYIAVFNVTSHKSQVRYRLDVMHMTFELFHVCYCTVYTYIDISGPRHGIGK